MEKLTICTYNVHCFYDESGQCRVEEVARLLGQEEPQVVCLLLSYSPRWCVSRRQGAYTSPG